ncbi:hypothetical protein B5P43_22365 [Bacillus sp. SRB_336]|nr:hypothetical protein B5P43_22365 [Bacillus sp. SRB_336]
MRRCRPARPRSYRRPAPAAAPRRRTRWRRGADPPGPGTRHRPVPLPSYRPASDRPASDRHASDRRASDQRASDQRRGRAHRRVDVSPRTARPGRWPRRAVPRHGSSTVRPRSPPDRPPPMYGRRPLVTPVRSIPIPWPPFAWWPRSSCPLHAAPRRDAGRACGRLRRALL